MVVALKKTNQPQLVNHPKAMLEVMNQYNLLIYNIFAFLDLWAIKS
jgi:hypothetical protein